MICVTVSHNGISSEVDVFANVGTVSVEECAKLDVEVFVNRDGQDGDSGVGMINWSLAQW